MIYYAINWLISIRLFDGATIPDCAVSVFWFPFLIFHAYSTVLFTDISESELLNLYHALRICISVRSNVYTVNGSYALSSRIIEVSKFVSLFLTVGITYIVGEERWE